MGVETSKRPRLGTRGVPREVREPEMVLAATRLFAGREYGDVAMDDVAQAADVSKPMVYAYFESKQGLFLACVEHAKDQLLRRLEEAAPTTIPPDQRLWRGLLATFDFIEENPDAWTLLSPTGPKASGQLAAGVARTQEAVAELLQRLLLESALAEGIDEKVAREAIEPLAQALVGAVHAVAAWSLRHPDEPKDRQALRLMNLVWMGFDDILRGNLWLPPPKGGAQPDR
jgi:AcrR family transcriptional regulator